MKIENAVKENPCLKQKAMKDGRTSLYLEYYLGGVHEPILDEDGNPVHYTDGAMCGRPKYKTIHKRKKEFLGLYLLAKPKTPAEKQQNKDTLILAQKIRFEKEQQFKEAKDGYRLAKSRHTDFYAFCSHYVANYTKKDKRMIKGAVKYFQDFICSRPDMSIYKERLNIEAITPVMVRAFCDYLCATHQGEGANTYYSRFKKTLKYAVEREILLKSPCEGITLQIDKGTIKKDILSPEEIKQLLHTHYEGENPNIRRAFAFSLFCGLRFCDVSTLTFESVDYANRVLQFDQTKTKGHSSASGVVIPLNDALIKLIGEPKETRQELVFPLPSHTMCLKALRHWVARAKIDKHITWHCARHSFAVNILNNGANIKTVASLLGHSGLQHTDKYMRAVDKLKQDAINSLGDIEV